MNTQSFVNIKIFKKDYPQTCCSDRGRLVRIKDLPVSINEIKVSYSWNPGFQMVENHNSYRSNITDIAISRDISKREVSGLV